MAQKLGQMEQYFKEIIRQDARMDQESFSGLMAHHIREGLKMMNSTVWGTIPTPMVERTLVSGNTEKSMVKES